MAEPRSIAYSPDRSLTDSRVYNLIWMGRWLQRADHWFHQEALSEEEVYRRFVQQQQQQ